jgi:hypothetical protein
VIPFFLIFILIHQNNGKLWVYTCILRTLEPVRALKIHVWTQSYPFIARIWINMFGVFGNITNLKFSFHCGNMSVSHESLQSTDIYFYCVGFHVFDKFLGRRLFLFIKLIHIGEDFRFPRGGHVGTGSLFRCVFLVNAQEEDNRSCLLRVNETRKTLLACVCFRIPTLYRTWKLWAKRLSSKTRSRLQKHRASKRHHQMPREEQLFICTNIIYY